jgi:hypothetical protein
MNFSRAFQSICQALSEVKDLKVVSGLTAPDSGYFVSNKAKTGIFNSDKSAPNQVTANEY